MISERNLNFLSYTIQCLIGTGIGFYLTTKFPSIGHWGLFSIILVIAPERKDALLLAFNRIKANFIGASVGLLIFAFPPVNLLMVSLGIAVVCLICEVLKLQAVSRSAIIALLIITLHEPGQHFWDVAIERAMGVFVGCVIGILVTYAFHHILIRLKPILLSKS